MLVDPFAVIGEMAIDGLGVEAEVGQVVTMDAVFVLGVGGEPNPSIDNPPLSGSTP